MGTAEKYSFLAALELDDADLLDVKLNKLLEYLGSCVSLHPTLVWMGESGSACW